MSQLLVTQVQAVPRLDYSFLRRVFFGMGALLVLIAPSVRDPLAFAVGGMVPWAILSLVGIRTMPAAVPYLLLWQWMQIFARTVLTLIDGEQIGSGLFGSNVERAYWYMLASVLVLACVFRLCLGNLRKSTLEDRLILYEWRPNDLFTAYIVAQLISSASYYGMTVVPALGQQFEALVRIKALALFVLFTTILTTGVGTRLLVGVVVLEIVIGFSGLLSDFREVFIFLAISALAARIKWTGRMTISGVAWFGVLVFLALFWTSVKADFRQFATRSDESQKVRVDIDERLGYLGGRALNLHDTDWGGSAYMLLARLAYVDIFGSVITVAEVTPEGSFGRQWSDAFEHVMKPRFLFPDKAALSDTEVYMRLAHGNVSEEMRLGTSISVGYMAENFADFGFPGMLAGVALLGLIMAGICRFFMANHRLPWVVREGIVVAYIFTVGRDGVEISLPKMLGGSLLFLVVYALLVRFFLPSALRWLNTRAEFREPQLS